MLKAVIFGRKVVDTDDLNVGEFIKRLRKDGCMAECLDEIISGDGLAHCSPSSDVYLSAAEELDVKPEECVVIEDSRDKIMAARSAGMICIGFDNGASKNGDLSGEWYLIEGFEELDKKFIDMVYCHSLNIPFRVMSTERTFIDEMTCSMEAVDGKKSADICGMSDTDVLTTLLRECDYKVFDLKGISDPADDCNQTKIREYWKAYTDNMYRFYGYGIWTVRSRENNDIIGFAGVDEEGFCGYIIRSAYRRRGYALEVLKAVTGYMFETVGFDSLYAHTDAANFPSINLLKNSGFKDVKGDGTLWKISRRKDYI